ncbi:hypothetical protein NL676_005310 [Syzygium grande]|nr:hypothetical protein NL676_005310 [Syzygium grande]
MVQQKEDCRLGSVAGSVAGNSYVVIEARKMATQFDKRHWARCSEASEMPAALNDVTNSALPTVVQSAIGRLRSSGLRLQSRETAVAPPS